MPRTTKVETPGCPPIRALTFDVLGLIKVVEARGKQGGVPTVVEKWGEPESSRCVLAASTNDSAHDPLLAVARKSGLIEVLSSLTGDLRVSIANSSHADQQSQDDNVVGLHIFKRPKLGSSSRSCTLLTCSTKGHANLRPVEVPKTGHDTISSKPAKTWDVCASGNISFSKVDGNEKYALFGGKGVEVNVWDLDSCVKIWSAKSPAKNSLGIFDPTWFTSATFLSKDDHRKFVAGTNNHQVRLYDISAQRRPVISFEFRETPIKAVTEDPDGNTIYVGNGSGDLASFDIRTGKLLGCFLGKGAGSIRSMARHPELPVLASCGLDSYLRFWDVNSRQLLSAVFLKQILSNVLFDSHFTDEAKAIVPAKAIDTMDDEVEETLPVKPKKTSKELDRTTKHKSKKRSKKIESDEVDVSEAVVPEESLDDEVDEFLLGKGKKRSKALGETKNVESKKRSKKIESDEVDVSEAVVPEESLDDEVDEFLLGKGKKRSKALGETKNVESKKRSKKIENDEAVVHEEALDDEVEESLLLKGKKRSKEHDQTKKLKSKKRSKTIGNDDVDELEAVVPGEALDDDKAKNGSKEHDDPSKKLKSKKRSKKIESDKVDPSEAVIPEESLDDEVEKSLLVLVKQKKTSKEHNKTKKPRTKKSKKIESDEG